MLNRFDLWKYSDTSNCWDFVREWLIDVGANELSLPRFGICPTDKRSMTKASKNVIIGLQECGPIQNAIACHYHDKVLFHVGIVDGRHVRHANQKSGLRRDTIKRFESMAQKTIYRIPKCLL